MITGRCLVVLHPPAAACWLRPYPVSVCLHHRGTSLFSRLQPNNLFSVFYPKSAGHDPGSSPGQTWARLLAAKRTAASAGSSQQAADGRGKGAKPLGSQLPLQRLLGRPRGSGARSCSNELVPKPAFQYRGLPRGVSTPTVFRRRKWCF